MLAKPHNIARLLGRDEKPRQSNVPAGFAKLPVGLGFRCTDCEYVRNGICQHDDPAVHGKHVTAANCCNHFDNPKMDKISGW